MLDASCANFVGQTVFIWPIHGWGWWAWKGSKNAAPDEDAPGFYIEAPLPFSLRVASVTWHRGKMNGFLGRVEAENHELDGLHAALYLRVSGNFDLLSTIPYVDILFGPTEPFLGLLSDEPELERHVQETGHQLWYPLWRFIGSPQFGGNAIVGASRELCQRHLDI